MDVLAVVPDVAPELEAVVDEAAAPKVPFYKRDFSLKRGSSEPKQKKEPKPKKEPKQKKERKSKAERQSTDKPKLETGRLPDRRPSDRREAAVLQARLFVQALREAMGRS